MRITGRQIRQIIREELGRTLREGFWGDDPPEEGSGYQHLSAESPILDLTDGPVRMQWVNEMLEHLRSFPPYMLPMLVQDFEKMLAGRPVGVDVANMYRSKGGTVFLSRRSVEALLSALQGG